MVFTVFQHLNVLGFQVTVQVTVSTLLSAWSTRAVGVQKS